MSSFSPGDRVTVVAPGYPFHEAKGVVAEVYDHDISVRVKFDEPVQVSRQTTTPGTVFTASGDTDNKPRRTSVGATTDFRVYKIADKKTVKAKFSEACEHARYESGHGGYSGTIAEMHGVGKWMNMLLPGIDEAEDYIMNHHEKWEDAMAISFMLADGTFGWVVGGWCSE